MTTGSKKMMWVSHASALCVSTEEYAEGTVEETGRRTTR